MLSGEARKDEVVGALLDERKNIALCAFLLGLYAAQWETANTGWGIRHRPDILATLYQIGFERSHPKPDPRPNEFGQRVLEVFGEPWMQEHFGPAFQLGVRTRRRIAGADRMSPSLPTDGTCSTRHRKAPDPLAVRASQPAGITAVAKIGRNL